MTSLWRHFYKRWVTATMPLKGKVQHLFLCFLLAEGRGALPIKLRCIHCIVNETNKYMFGVRTGPWPAQSLKIRRPYILMHVQNFFMMTSRWMNATPPPRWSADVPRWRCRVDRRPAWRHQVHPTVSTSPSGRARQADCRRWRRGWERPCDEPNGRWAHRAIWRPVASSGCWL